MKSYYEVAIVLCLMDLKMELLGIAGFHEVIVFVGEKERGYCANHAPHACAFGLATVFVVLLASAGLKRAFSE